MADRLVFEWRWRTRNASTRSLFKTRLGITKALGANWKTRREFWKDRAAERRLRCAQICFRWQTTRTRHVGNDPNVERYDPDLWTDEFYFLNQPGQADIQSDLFYDYRTNVDAYPKWQAWMQKTQPRLLVIWGKYDLSFDPGEPERYRKDCAERRSSRPRRGTFRARYQGGRNRGAR